MNEPLKDPGGRSGEERVSQLVGDRLCVRCGFNLAGQTVVREPVYGLIMVRCPECSAPAALQEYPLLGRWANRWAALLAALWLIVLLAAMAGTTGMLGGISAGAAEDGGHKLATFIAQRHQKWLATQDSAVRAAMPQWIAAMGTQPAGPYTWMDSGWWEAQDADESLRAAGGFLGALDPSVFTVLPFLWLGAAVAGVFWSVALLGVRRRRVMLVVLTPLVLAIGIGWMVTHSNSSWPGMGNVVRAGDAAGSIIGWRLFLVSLGTAWPALWLGVWLGRPLVRLLARVLLPARMTGSLAFLWMAEGLEPPRPARR